MMRRLSELAAAARAPVQEAARLRAGGATPAQVEECVDDLQHGWRESWRCVRKPRTCWRPPAPHWCGGSGGGGGGSSDSGGGGEVDGGGTHPWGESNMVPRLRADTVAAAQTIMQRAARVQLHNHSLCCCCVGSMDACGGGRTPTRCQGTGTASRGAAEVIAAARPRQR
ncbi:hypothetical protein JKP88DRAFT_59467 [Tribonema minus]|uniref:Uncharacterized protein n=1 Tax=Tribonema minus TaxID=303371 RepID=A0A835YVJ4_9STRA|nr:hypothetical protein JKP88DRAFT_59467 [Tribonema minus]